MDKDKYIKKKKNELGWYSTRKFKSKSSHKVLKHKYIFSLDRVIFNYIFPKEQMSKFAQNHLQQKAGRILNAPCGRGNDIEYINMLSSFIVGLDLSPVAFENITYPMMPVLGDILTLPFSDNSFNGIFSPLFFHHFIHYDFFPFLSEFYRVTKPDGGIVILEPSLWYPVNLLTRPIKHLFSNPYGEVEDEGPFPPGRMIADLKKAGYINIDFQAATFSHPAFYKPVAKIVNQTSKFLLNLWPFKYFGWLVVYWGEKTSLR